LNYENGCGDCGGISFKSTLEGYRRNGWWGAIYASLGIYYYFPQNSVRHPGIELLAIFYERRCNRLSEEALKIGYESRREAASKRNAERLAQSRAMRGSIGKSA
jgi:hypothetical protein